MIGIDHEMATLIQRERFAFTSSQREEAMKRVVGEFGASGSILISTCNRTELWISESTPSLEDMAEWLLELKKIPATLAEGYADLWVRREGLEAVRHLFQTACGLKSQVFGEDQILSQIKNAIETGRKAKTTDAILEKVFQMAVTSAKRIKTDVRITLRDPSIAQEMMEFLAANWGDLSGFKCMVIGNGEMGKLAASKMALQCKSCHVTLRNYGHENLAVPNGCQAVNYENRYKMLNEVDIVVSSTASPHYTLHKEEAAAYLEGRNRPLILIDLAVPRDIDSKIGTMSEVFLYDLDHLGGSTQDRIEENILAAEEIIQEYLVELEKWHRLKEFLPTIRKIAMTTTQRISNKMKKELEELGLEEQEKIYLEKQLSKISENAVRGLLFNVKDSIEIENWDSCFKKLEKTVR
jgi:glutamyl-tRNA reductase